MVLRRRLLGDGGVAKGIGGVGRRRWLGGTDTMACGGSSSGDVGSTDACGGSGISGDDDWTPSPTFHEQPLKREETSFFSQMTARVCGGGGGSLPLL